MAATAVEDFQDFTIATNWERFAAAIEDVYQEWTAAGVLRGEAVQQGSNGLQKVLHHQLPQRHGPYLITVSFDPSSPAETCSPDISTAESPQLPLLDSASTSANIPDLAGSAGKAEETNAEPGLVPTTSQAPNTHHFLSAAEGKSQATESGSKPQDFAAPVQGHEPAEEDSSLSRGVSDVKSNERSWMAGEQGLQSGLDDDASRNSSTGIYSELSRLSGGAAADSLTLERLADGANHVSDREQSRSASPFSGGGAMGGMPALEEDEHLELNNEDHSKLRTWFGVRACVTLVPLSYSRRIMDEQEANLLLSALAVAASASGWPLPAFVPVHDALRDAYWGIGLAGAHSTIHYDTDSVHISNLPAHLEQAKGQLEVLADRLGAHAPDAAAACWQILRDRQGASGVDGSQVLVSLRRTYRVPRPVQEGRSADSDDEDIGLWVEEWDADCAWSPWAAHVDPISDLELDVEWFRLPGHAALNSANLDLDAATCWRLHALKNPDTDANQPAFFLQVPFRGGRPGAPRQHLTLRPADDESAGQPNADADNAPKSRSFAAMLAVLMRSKAICCDAIALGQLAKLEWWEMRGTDFPAAPPDAVLQDVLRDMFQAPELPAAFLGWRGALAKDVPPPLGLTQDKWGFSRGLPHCAPASSLASRLALHAMTFSNPRSVAILWTRFVRELRFAHWETLTPLPRMQYAAPDQASAANMANEGASSSGSTGKDGNAASAAKQPFAPPAPDLRFGLLHQKLQMLNLCISRRRALQETRRKQKEELQWERAPVVDLSSDDEFASCSEGATSSVEADTTAPAVQTKGGEEACGVKRVLQGVRLLGGDRGPMSEPITQEAPVLTEDLLQERSAALAALGENMEEQNARARMQGDVLASDMAAFKAANPGALLEDFVRWHSPRDWLLDAQAPLGGRLSPRISGVWLQLWEGAPAQAAAEQKPLMDPLLEGERALHWLETLPPESLWAQITPLCLAASAACLASSNAASLPTVNALLTWFHALAGGVLDQPPVSDPSFASLLSALQHVETVVVAAESLSRRLPGAPRLVCHLLHLAGCGLDNMKPAAAVGEQPVIGVSRTAAACDQPVIGVSRSGAVGGQPVIDASRPERQEAARGEPDEAKAPVWKASEENVPHGISAEILDLQQEPFWEEGGTATGLLLSASEDRGMLQEQMGQAAESGEKGSAKWRPPLQSEWVIEVNSSDKGKPHRLYTLSRRGEMRLATACVAE